MANLLKNQILKPLSRFTKNLSPDQINVSAIKGEGELTNLELDENALMDLLDLPSWLLLKKAVCNHVAIKIQWTKLKSQPIVVTLDEVVVEIEALKDPRPPRKNAAPSYRSSSGSYGLIDRVLDGIKVSVNAVNISFKADAFHASIELARILVSSKLANWRPAEELKLTSLRDPSQDAILLFKEIEWETTRVEATGMEGMQITPVRLIINSTSIRLTLKKRLSDCAILSSRVQFLMDDLLWVLTVSQLEAAIIFAKSLTKSILKSAEQSKSLAQEKILRQSTPEHGKSTTQSTSLPSSTLPQVTSIHPSMSSGIPPPVSASNQKMAQMRRIFSCYDILETSYHTSCKRIELHFCEEGDQKSKLSSNAVGSGSLLLSMVKVNIDFYPFHRHSMDKRHWRGYSELAVSRASWASRLMDHFNKTHPQPSNSQRILMESAVVMRLTDIQMKTVATVQKPHPSPFLGSDKDIFKLPSDTITVFVDFTDYYYTDQSKDNLPPPDLFCQLNPIHLRLDYQTVVWLNAFFLNIATNLKLSMQKYIQYGLGDILATVAEQSGRPPVKLNSRLEALMPRLIFPAELDIASGQPERPTALQVQASSLILSNHIPGRLPPGSEMTALLTSYRQKSFYTTTAQFPKRPGDSGVNWTIFQMPDSELYWVHCTQLWADFTGAKTAGNRPQPLMEPVALTLWAHLSQPSPSPAPHSPYRHLPPGAMTASNHDRYSTSSGGNGIGNPQAMEVNLAVDLGSSVMALHLSHYQFLFITRLMESVERMMECLEEDLDQVYLQPIASMKQDPRSPRIALNATPAVSPVRIRVACRVDQLAFTLMLPALCEPLPKMDSTGSIFMTERSWPTSPVHHTNQNVTYLKDTPSHTPVTSVTYVAENGITVFDSRQSTLTNTNTTVLGSSRVSVPTDNGTVRSDMEIRGQGVGGRVGSSFSIRRGSKGQNSDGRKQVLHQSFNQWGSSFAKFGEKMLASVQATNFEEPVPTHSVDSSPPVSEASDSDEDAILSLYREALERETSSLIGSERGSFLHQRSTSELQNILAAEAACKPSEDRDEAFSVTSSATSRNRDVFSTVTLNISGIDTNISVDKGSICLATIISAVSIIESGRGLVNHHSESSVPLATTADILGPLLACRIEIVKPLIDNTSEKKAPVPPTPNIEARLLRPLDLNLLLSSCVNMADFFEEEIQSHFTSPDLSTPTSVSSSSPLSPNLLFDLVAGPVTLRLDDDTPCSNLTCPGPHPPIQVEIPRGLRVSKSAKDSILKVSISPSLLTPQSSVQPPPPPVVRPSSPASTQTTAPPGQLYLTVGGLDPHLQQPWSSTSSVCSLANSISLGTQTPALPPSQTPSPVPGAGTPVNSPAMGGHAPSQELLKRYYSENVKLREKVDSMRKERLQVVDDLSVAQIAIDDLKRERDQLVTRLEAMTLEFHKPGPPVPPPPTYRPAVPGSPRVYNKPPL